MQYKIIHKLLLISVILAVNNPVLADKKLVKEYGIVILPSKNCTDKAQILNKEISHKLPDLENSSNEWHVSLFHGAYSETYVNELINLMTTIELKPIELYFDKIYSTSDRWIDFGVKKNTQLDKLHKKIVKAASRLTQRPLKRAYDIYKELPHDKKKQIDEYGVHGVLEYYKPHMTLFYQYPADARLKAIVKEVARTVKPIKCRAEKIAIAELEYNGNISKIISTIDLP